MNIYRPVTSNNRRKVWLFVALLVILAFLVILSMLVLTHESSHGIAGLNNTGTIEPQSLSVKPNALLTLKEQTGNISIYPSHTNVITVTPRKGGTTLAPQANSLQLLINHTLNSHGNDQIAVSVDPWSTNTDFAITIPDTTAIQITLNSGSIDVHGGNGLTASTGNGSIDVDTIHGPVNVQTDSGDVTATSINGPLTVSASSGTIKMQQVTGQVNAHTWSGDVIATNMTLSGKSLLQTQSGSVRFSGSLDPHGSYRMQTSSGDVDLTLPGNTAFILDASTGSGSVENDFATNTVGTAPRSSLSLHTQSGSIAIVKSS